MEDVNYGRYEIIGQAHSRIDRAIYADEVYTNPNNDYDYNLFLHNCTTTSLKALELASWRGVNYYLDEIIDEIRPDKVYDLLMEDVESGGGLVASVHN